MKNTWKKRFRYTLMLPIYFYEEFIRITERNNEKKVVTTSYDCFRMASVQTISPEE